MVTWLLSESFYLSPYVGSLLERPLLNGLGCLAPAKSLPRNEPYGCSSAAWLHAKLPAARIPQTERLLAQPSAFVFHLPVWRLLYAMLAPRASRYQWDVSFLWSLLSSSWLKTTDFYDFYDPETRQPWLSFWRLCLTCPASLHWSRCLNTSISKWLFQKNKQQKVWPSL